MMITRGLGWALLLSLSAQADVAKVYVRWTHPELPSIKTLGTDDLVLPWSDSVKDLLVRGVARGFHVYLETPPENVVTAAEAAFKGGAAGVIIAPQASGEADGEVAAQSLRTRYPKLKILVLSPGGHQPEMRGWLVFNKNGILQVSSPTSQPWLDSNVALVRYQQGLQNNRPPLYAFSWDLTSPLTREQGPQPQDYALAIAEAGALHADLILEVHDKQQEHLARGEPDTLADWELVKKAFDFYRLADPDGSEPAACVAVLVQDYETAYEPMNLMARHNIPYRVFHSSQMKTADLQDFDVVIAFTELEKELAQALSAFAEAGGTVVLVNLKGAYPWDSDASGKTSGPSTTHTVGNGRVIELHEAISDPETFARDVRRLMAKQRIPVSLWNSLTTLVIAYPEEKSGGVTLELVNYAQESTQVQVRVKGKFASLKFETPEHPNWETLKASSVDGFTEFVVPGVVIGGRVRLNKAGSSR